MVHRNVRAALIAAASIAVALSATPAAAAGCNGVVNPFVWGCAPWDNNNGPQHAYYKVKKIRIPNSEVRVENQRGVPMVAYQGQWLPIISRDGAGIVAGGAGN